MFVLLTHLTNIGNWGGESAVSVESISMRIILKNIRTLKCLSHTIRNIFSDLTLVHPTQISS